MTCVLRIDNLSKEYRLGVHGHGMLFRDVQSWWARVRGKEDPNSPLDSGARNKQKSNGKIWALKDVSLEVKQGEVLGIIGRNGAGKSTLLKVLSKVTAPTRGTIKIRGQVASLLEVGTGFHPELTGRENIYLNGAIMGMSVKEISKKFDEILNFAGVEPFIDTPVKRYSSGMYVRLAFAVAAHLEPEILLVDEVLAVGDAAFQSKCLKKMGDVTTGGGTVLFVSHHMAAVQNLCRRAILFDSGKIVDDGPADPVTRKYLADAVPVNISSSFAAPENPEITFQILKIYMTDADGNSISSAGLWDHLQIRVVLMVRRKLVGSNVCITVSRDGHDLYNSFDTDMSPELLHNRPPGVYLAAVPLPAGILPVGEYTVSVTTAFGLFPGFEMGNTGDTQRHAVMFSVLDGHGDSALKSYSRPAVIIARLTWKIDRLEGTDAG